MFTFFFFIFLLIISSFTSFFFFFNDTATTEIYTLSLHDALPISVSRRVRRRLGPEVLHRTVAPLRSRFRSEEHTSELQSQSNLVCRLLLEKKKKKKDKRKLTTYISKTNKA